MKNTIAQLTALLFFILGCAQTSTVLYKPDAVYSSTDNLEVYDDKTNIPYEYFVIGQVSSRIEGTGQQQHLMEKMKEKAMAQGAEGLIDIEVSTALKLYALVDNQETVCQAKMIRFKRDNHGAPIARRGNAEPENTDAFSIEQMAVSAQSKKNEQEKPPTMANMSSKNRQPEVDTNTEDMKDIVEELFEDEKPTYIAIKKVLNKYILLYQGTETPMVIEDEYPIVRGMGSEKFLTIGTAKVVKIKGTAVALKPSLERRYRPVTILDKVEYIQKMTHDN